jgi:hypothetical protein
MKENQMSELSARHVEAAEATRLGVKSGWYGTKVSGTFVTGPHETEKECMVQVKVLSPAVVPASKRRD